MPEPIQPACAEVVIVDGVPVLVRGEQPLTADARDAIATAVRAARAKLADKIEEGQ